MNRLNYACVYTVVYVWLLKATIAPAISFR